MGKGNVCAGAHDAVYYIDYDNLYVYTHKNTQDVCLGKDIPCDKADEYVFDEDLTQQNYNDFINEFCDHMTSIKDPFTKTDKTNQRTRRVIAENKLFDLCVEDNTWSLAAELIWSDEYNPDEKLSFEAARKEMTDYLLKKFQSISYRTSSWTHGTITADAINPIQ